MITKSTETPRTDAVAEHWLAPGLRDECEIVNAAFARELERENARLREGLEKIAKSGSAGTGVGQLIAKDILSNVRDHR
jgi:hypothetical protein